MLCTVLRAASMQTIAKPPSEMSKPVQAPIPAPITKAEHELTDLTELEAPTKSKSPPETTVESSPAAEHTWMITQDLDEHIDSFLSTRDRARFSRTSHNNYNEMAFFGRQRLKPEYQSEPYPLRAYRAPEKRKDIEFPTNKAGREYVEMMLVNKPFLLQKVKAGHFTLQQALQFGENSKIRIDKFLNSGSASQETSDRIKNLRRFIESGILTFEECLKATGTGLAEKMDQYVFETYFMCGSLDKARFLDLTREEVRLLGEPLVQGLIIGRRWISANQALDLIPTELDELKYRLRMYLTTPTGPGF